MGRHWAPNENPNVAPPPARVPRLFDKQSIACLSIVFGVMLLLGTLAAMREVEQVFPRAMPAFLAPPPTHPFTQPPVDAGVTAAYPRVLADPVRELGFDQALPIGSVIVEATEHTTPPKEHSHENRNPRALDAPKPRQGGHDVRPRPRPGHGGRPHSGEAGGQHPRPRPGSGHGGSTIPGAGGVDLGGFDGWLAELRRAARAGRDAPAQPSSRVERRQHLPRVSHRDRDGGGGSSSSESVESPRRSVDDSDQKSGDEKSSTESSGSDAE